MKHYKTFFFFIFILVWATNSQAQKLPKWKEIYLLDKNDFNPYVEFFSEDISDYHHPESGNNYPSTNLFDTYFKSCWVAGSTKTKQSNALYMRVPEAISPNQLILNTFPGYGKSKLLFYQNARPKNIKLNFYIGFYPEGFSTEVASLYLLKELPIEENIQVQDSFRLQSFPLNLKEEKLKVWQEEAETQIKDFSGPAYNSLAENNPPKSFQASIIIKLTIVDSYSGSKYDDICLSEIFFNNRFISAYPDKYNPVLQVYIKNDSLLLADYASQKNVVLLKSSSRVFTYVDWPENSNWALVHFVDESSLGENTRVEEQSLLIDLKNKKVVNQAFQQCTGESVMFQLLDKKENGKVYTDNGNLEIELK
jgi:hypothetical protein